MMAFMRHVAWILILSFLFSSSSLALWDNSDGSVETATPEHVIIKLASPAGSHATAVGQSTVVSNTAALETVHQKFGVTNRKRVMPDETWQAIDNPLRNVWVVEVPPGVDARALAHEYARLDGVVFAEPDYPLQLHLAPDDPLFGHQWALHNTGQGYYHVLRREGDNNDSLVTAYGTADADVDGLEVIESPPVATTPVIVALTDTGVDPDHPELAGRIWVNPGEIAGNGIDDDHNGYVDDVNGWHFDAESATFGDNDIGDTHGHGTHCAGIMTAVTDNTTGISGMAPDVRIMALRMFPRITHLGAATAICYAADNGADVISMSWGGPYLSGLLQEALAYAESRGCVLVASAGNNGTLQTLYPSGYDETISVSASNSDDRITTWSTFNDAVTVCAPGQSVLSLRAAGTDMYAGANEPLVHIIDENYYLASGTSMSAPHVSAVAAYLRAVSPGLTVAAVREILTATADDYLDPRGYGENLPGWDRYSGYGRINLQSALAAAPGIRALISSPGNREIVTGMLNIIGTADGAEFTEYTLDYGLGGDPASWTTITTSVFPVTDGILGSLDMTGLTGQITLRLRVGDDNAAAVRIYSGEPLIGIESPSDGSIIGGEVTILGSAICPGFSYYLLEHDGGATAPDEWRTIDTGTAAVDGSELGSWNTVTLDEDVYRLRLLVYADTGLVGGDTIQVEIRSVFTAPDGWKIYAGGELAPTLNYADVDTDGENEILAGHESGLTIFNLDGTIATIGVPAFPPDDYRVAPAVGRLDDDGFDDVVAVGGSGTLYIYSSQHGLSQTTLSEAPDNFAYFIPGDESRVPKVFLKDINDDGIDEIHYLTGTALGGRSGYYFIYRADGNPWVCGFPPAAEYRRCLPADVDGDGIDEIYCYGDSLTQFDTCGTAVRSLAIISGETPMFDYWMDLSAVDVDNDGKVELLVHGMFVHNPYEVERYSLFVFDEDLQLKDGWPHDLGIPGTLLAAAHPVFGDLDNDGSLEYMTTTGDFDNGYIYAWHLDGTPLVGDSTGFGLFSTSPTPACYTAPLVADVDNSGTAEIIVSSGAGLNFKLMIERLLAYTDEAVLVDGYPLVVNNQFAISSLHIGMVGDITGDGYLDVAYPTDWGEVAFTSFTTIPYNPQLSFAPMWRYNRRLNATYLPQAEYMCGDANGDGDINVGDAVSIINFVFKGGPPPNPPENGDANCDGATDVGDAVYLINYVFKGGPGPCLNCP